MVSTSSWNSGDGLSASLMPAASAYVVPCSFKSSSTTDWWDIAATYPGCRAGKRTVRGANLRSSGRGRRQDALGVLGTEELRR